MNTHEFFKKYYKWPNNFKSVIQIQQAIIDDYPIFRSWSPNHSWLQIKNTNLLICHKFNDLNWYTVPSSWASFAEKNNAPFEVVLPVNINPYNKDTVFVIENIPDQSIKIELLKALIDLAENND